jgi:hypothetical protein
LSVILDTLLLKTKETTKSKHGEPKTSYILLISVAITMAIILLMYGGIYYTEGMMKQNFTCKDKIVEYEQHAMYPSPEEFRLALSLCDSNENVK